MITELEVEAYLATGDRKYINRAGPERAVKIGKLQQLNGLMYHLPAEAPFFSGRGNGRVLAGTAELLRSLPAENPNRCLIPGRRRRLMALCCGFSAMTGHGGN